MPNFDKSKGFTLKSGNTPLFKHMGSAAKDYSVSKGSHDHPHGETPATMKYGSMAKMYGKTPAKDLTTEARSGKEGAKNHNANYKNQTAEQHKADMHTRGGKGTPKEKMKGKSPAKHKKDGKYTGHNHKGMKLFERVTGKKFVDTKLGKSIAGEKKKVVTKTVDKQLEKKKETNVPATNLKVKKSSADNKTTKPASRKPKKYTAVGNPNETFVRGGGDPYQYQTKDGGKTFQYKKIGESKWNEVKGGKDKVSASYSSL